MLSKTPNENITENICKDIHNSILNSKTCEDDLISLSLKTDVEQRMDICEKYKSMYGESLISALKNRLRGTTFSLRRRF